jgi:hypothetical protein
MLGFAHCLHWPIKFQDKLLSLKKIKHLIIVDGRRNECSKEIVDNLGIKYGSYLNLEYDFGITKLEPFTFFNYSENDIKSIPLVIMKNKGVFPVTAYSL